MHDRHFSHSIQVTLCCVKHTPHNKLRGTDMTAFIVDWFYTVNCESLFCSVCVFPPLQFGTISNKPTLTARAAAKLIDFLRSAAAACSNGCTCTLLMQRCRWMHSRPHPIANYKLPSHSRHSSPSLNQSLTQ